MSREKRRFVISEHTAGRGVHWDFMLESGGILETYRFDKGPEDILEEGAGAEKIFDHQLRFLTYEGSINKGEGSVRIVESGTYKILRESEGEITIELDGKILKGKFVLRQVKGEKWQFGAKLIM